MKIASRLVRLTGGATHRKRWAALVALSILVGVMESLAALLVFALIDVVIGPETSNAAPLVSGIISGFGDIAAGDRARQIGIAVVFFFGIRAIIFFLQAYLQQRMAHNAAVRLSSELFVGYLRMPYSFHLRRNTADLIRNAHQSVQQVAMFGFVPAVILISESLLSVGVISALILTSPKVTMTLLLIVVPFTYLVLRTSRRALASLGETSQEMAGTTFRHLQQSLQGVRDIKILGRTSFFEGLFRSSRSALARSMYLKGVTAEIPRVATESLFMIGLGSAVAIIGTSQGTVQDSIPSLGLFAYAGMRLMPAVNRVVVSVNNLQFAGPAVETVHTELQMVRSVSLPHPDAGDIKPMSRAIELSTVSYGYNDKDLVLKEVNLEIAHGEVIGVVGPTGSGKSTLIDLMVGLLEPSTGMIAVDGVPIRNNIESWQQQIGLVPQHPFLLDESIQRNIALGLEDRRVDRSRISECLGLACLDKFVSTLPEGTDTIIGEQGVRLSGGQRQRVAIARALYRQPDILFLDEATSALDRITEVEVIGNLTHSRVSTLIMIAHRVQTLQRCDRIIVFLDGRVSAVGHFDELLSSNEVFRQMAQ